MEIRINHTCCNIISQHASRPLFIMLSTITASSVPCFHSSQCGTTYLEMIAAKCCVVLTRAGEIILWAGFLKTWSDDLRQRLLFQIRQTTLWWWDSCGDNCSYKPASNGLLSKYTQTVYIVLHLKVVTGLFPRWPAWTDGDGHDSHSDLPTLERVGSARQHPSCSYMPIFLSGINLLANEYLRDEGT